MNSESDNVVRLLLVEDLPFDADVARREILREVKLCEIHRVETRERFLEELTSFHPHVIVSDYNLPRFDGLTALQLAKERAPLTPLIILTSSTNEDTAVTCMKAGAANYVVKERMKHLGQTVIRAIEEGRLRRERQAAEEALRKRESYFRSLIENAQDLITVLDTKGVVLFQSPSIERILGYPLQEFVGRSVFELIHPEDQVRAGESLQRVFANAKIANSTEFRVRHADGAWRVLESVGNPILGDAPPAVVLNSRDITERHRLEDQLRQAQKMEAVGQLASGVAHDFNNILTTIMGNASMLRGDGNLNASHGSEIDEILKASERAAQLTRQLLLFSRKQTMQTTNLDLNDAVSQMLKMLRRVLGEDVNISLDYAKGLPLINADAGMIDQVLLNLAVNARDAMPNGGSLTFKTSLRHPAVTPGSTQPAMVCLTVSDTGCGIHPDHLPHIFEPFFTTKAVGKGTGLGLATVYGIVKQHGGAIEVTSQVGRGTNFHIELPAMGADAARKLASDSPTIALGNSEVILLVEDEISVRLLVNRLLQHCGYEVLQAGSGPEALDIWDQNKQNIQLLLTDIVMPDGMTGHELASRLRAERPQLRVIYSSGYSPELAGQHFENAPGTRFLQKPYSLDGLSKAVRECLDETFNPQLQCQ